MPLAFRIRRVSEDLRAVQLILESHAISGDSEDLVDKLDLELVQEFKSAIDNMRQFLWSYLENAATALGADPKTALQAFRMRRATEMLRVLEAPLHEMRKEALPEAESFIEQVTRMATLAIQKHQDDDESANVSQA